ncbi:hypothetical protein [Streptomyces sp. NPDC051219]|uniref:hypothetical protein n=1 Tax=Streptomyces sp. NPDC051219 TaxID=3155283 RepID=UPI003416667C
MKKKFAAAAVGVALGGSLIAVTLQGSAQAAPATPVAQTAATAQATGPIDTPQVIGSIAGKAAKAVGKAAGKAYVHGKAATGSGASNHSIIGSLWGAPPAGVSDQAPVPADVVFDK